MYVFRLKKNQLRFLKMPFADNNSFIVFYCKNMTAKSKPIQVTPLFYEAGRPFKYD